jgi:hypothetical protein
MIGREVVVWEDPLEKRARELKQTFPYGHEAFGLHAMIKLALWVAEQEKKK